MKRLLLTLATALLLTQQGWTQTMMGYDATVTQGTYSEITDGTVVPLGSITTKLDTVVIDKSYTLNTQAVTAEGLPIGFDFRYDSKLMNQFFIGGRGFLLLGKDQVTAGAIDNTYSTFSDDGFDEMIGFCFRGIVCAIPETEISYKTVGEAPNRQLVVQYKNLQLCADTWSGLSVRDTLQIQYRLHEGGTIEIQTYGFEPSAEVASEMGWRDYIKMGIRGTGTDRLMKKGNFMSDDFSTSESILSWNGTYFPADGTIYTFTAPEDCDSPAAGATNLVAEPTSNSISGQFTPSATADHYLVLVSPSATLSTLPEDGTYYDASSTLGDATVVSYTTDTTFTTKENLDAASTYYIHVVATNSYCFYAPKYNTADILSAAVSTRPGAPASITIAATDSTSISLNVAADTQGNDVIVAYTTKPKLNDYNQILSGGTFGTPSGTYADGDAIDGGGTVAYQGAAKDGISVTGLEAGKEYFFSAWSKNADGLYSSLSVETGALTAGIVPWTAKFLGRDDSDGPVGWNKLGSWTTDELDYDDAQVANSVTLRLDQTDGQNGVVQWIETPDVYMAEGENRLVMDILMKEYASWSWSTYEFHAKDSIMVQLTTDGENYTTLATYDQANPLTFKSTSEATTLRLTFAEAAGQKARLRLYMRLCGDPQTTLSNISIEQKKECDYPVDVQVPDSTIAGGDAVVVWTPQSAETQWDVRYKKSSAEEWNEPVTVSRKSYTLTGLDGTTSYDVQVRGRLSDEKLSDWSATCTFQSGLVSPFSMDFAAQDNLDSWQSKHGVLATPTSFTESNAWQFVSGWWSSSLRFDYSSAADEWWISPIIDLGEAGVNSIADFTISLSYEDASATDATLQLVVAADGETFNAADTVVTVKATDFPAAYESGTYTASLKGYSGKVRLGFYVHSTDANVPPMTLDNLTLRYSCPNDIVAQVDTIGEDTVHVSWTSDADEWLVCCRKVGETAKNYVKVTEPAYGVGGLKQYTNYELLLTKACEEGDTAKAVSLKFMTTGTYCAEPTDVVVEPSKYSAFLSWQGEASAYNVRYRQKAEPEAEWTVVRVSEPKYNITSLACNTEYEYAVQSQCGVDDNDTSEYTATASFSTLPDNCVVPANVAVDPSYNKATVTWEGDADTYDLAYRKADAEAWTSIIVSGNEYVIEQLEAETAYSLRMRSICAVGDSSLWTEPLSFTTEAIPECVTPSDLTVSDLTENSAVLSWQADESNLAWNLRYRESSVAAWTEEMGLETTSYQLNDLKSNTAYIWRVQAVCEEERTSQWASQQRFTTIESSIDRIGIAEVQVFVSNGMLNIVNPAGGFIESVSVYTTNGQMVASNKLNTRDNAFMRLTARGALIVKVKGQKHTSTVKVMVK